MIAYVAKLRWRALSLGYASLLPTSDAVLLPAVHSPATGAALVAMGCGLTLWAMHGLWVHGGGLPMNAFPPTSLVTRDAFALVAHPIYSG